MSKLGKTRRGSKSSVNEVTSTILDSEGKDNSDDKKDTLEPVIVLEQCSKKELTKIPEDSLESNETDVLISEQEKKQNSKENNNENKKLENNLQECNENVSESLIYESSKTESEVEKSSAEVLSNVERPESPILNRQKASKSKSKETIENDVKLSQQISVVLEVMKDKEEEVNKEGTSESNNMKNNLEIQEETTETIVIKETVETVIKRVCEDENFEKENVEIPNINGDENVDDLDVSINENECEPLKLSYGDDSNSDPDESVSSLDNASTAVNYSENTTRFIENSTVDDSLPINNTSTDSAVLRNSFVEQTRDLSYIKTLKTISGRKNVHDLRQKTFYNIKKIQGNDLSYNKDSFYRSDGSEKCLKRKNDSHTMMDEYVKRSRMDHDDSGLLSYVASPINKLKTRFSKSRQSTPIKSTVEYQNKCYSDEFNNDSMINTEKPNKWCTIQ